MKKITVLLCLCCLLCGCSKGELDYADDIPCAELMDTAERQIPVDFGYETFGGEHLSLYFEGMPTDDHCLRYSALSENVNEFGVFHSPDASSVKETEAMCEKYLDDLWQEKEAFIASYAPEELPMLADERFLELVRIFGSGRVLFGTDSPWDDMALCVERIRSLPLTSAEMEDIFHRNACMLLGI